MPQKRSRYHQINILLAAMLLVIAAREMKVQISHGQIVDVGTFLISDTCRYFVVAIVFAVLWTLKETATAQILQILAIVGTGVLVMLVMAPRDMGGDLLVILASVMTYKYGFMERRMLLKLIGLFGTLIVSRLISPLLSPDTTFFVAINQVVIGLSFIPVLYWVFEDELRRIARANRELERQARQNLPFVEFGRNVSGIVHDFKNDLSLFSMFGQLLRMNEGEALSQKQIVEYQSYVRRFEKRIERILSITRLSHTSETQMLDLVELVTAVVYVFQSDLRFKRVVNIVLDVPDHKVVVSSVPSDVVSILENFIRNGCEALVDHHGDSEAAVSDARLTVIVSDGDIPEITIGDNGPGIRECEMCPEGDCLSCGHFEIGKTTKPYGTGLGLVTVRNAARRIGADIVMSSVPHKGVSVLVSFPA